MKTAVVVLLGMSASRLPPAALSLKQVNAVSGPGVSVGTAAGSNSWFLCQFLQRQKVLQIYRTMLRTIRQVPDEADRRYLRDWARGEFRRNKDATNQVSRTGS